MRKKSAGRNSEDCTTAQQNICIQSWLSKVSGTRDQEKVICWPTRRKLKLRSRKLSAFTTMADYRKCLDNEVMRKNVLAETAS